jgi:hypothetical protein
MVVMGWAGNRGFWLLAATLFSLAAFAQDTSAEPLDTTVCEIVKHPLQFNGKLVRLHADAFGVLIDSPQALGDRSCPDSSLRIEFPHGRGGHNVRKLQKALAPLRKGGTTYIGRSASGTFIGIVCYAWVVNNGVDIHLTVEAAPELVIPALPATEQK